MCYKYLVLCLLLDLTGAVEKKIIIDNDAGGDDAMAIFLALLYEKHFSGPEVIGLTTVNGNTLEENVYVNNQKILKVAQRQDVPIYRGAKESLKYTAPPGGFYGKDGLGDNDEIISDLVPARTETAVDALINLSKLHEGHLIVVTLGSLTNIAMALQADPNFLNRLEQLYIGAGHIYSDEHNTAELNARVDAEAYHLVAQHAAPEKVTILPFSQVKQYLNFTRSWRTDVLGALDTKIMKAQNKFERLSIQRRDRWQALDPATITIALKPELVDGYKYSKNDIILDGEKRGINTHVFLNKEQANVRVAYSLKPEEYKEFLLNIFSKE